MAYPDDYANLQTDKKFTSLKVCFVKKKQVFLDNDQGQDFTFMIK